MDIDEFWHLIERAGRDARADNPDGNMARFVANLEQLLRAIGPQGVVGFRDHFEDRMREAYHFDLWGAAYVIGQGCSDDGFNDFCCWLISMGREVYEQALSDPESLLEPAVRPEVEDVFFEELHDVAPAVYKEMTGADIPDYPGPEYPYPPPGTKHRDDESDLPRRYPTLWARFSTR